MKAPRTTALIGSGLLLVVAVSSQGAAMMQPRGGFGGPGRFASRSSTFSNMSQRNVFVNRNVTVNRDVFVNRRVFVNRNVFVDRDIFFHRRFFHPHSSFFFVSSFPVYYPAYYSYPCYGYGGYSYPSYSEPVYSSGYEPADSPPQAVDYVQLGHDWARDVRQEIITWDQLVGYLKAQIANAPAGARDDFRRGFVAAYGSNGDAAFAKAMQQAQGDASGPDATAAPPSQSDSPARDSHHY